jgi:hypothetical protein
MGIKTKQQGDDIKNELEKAAYSISSMKRKEVKRSPFLLSPLFSPTGSFQEIKIPG